MRLLLVIAGIGLLFTPPLTLLGIAFIVVGLRMKRRERAARSS